MVKRQSSEPILTTDPNDLTDQPSAILFENEKNSSISTAEGQWRSDRSDRSVAAVSCSNDIQDSDNSPAIAQNIYRLGHSDIWGCNNCKLRGDKWYMRQHLCREIRSNS